MARSAHNAKLRELETLKVDDGPVVSQRIEALLEDLETNPLATSKQVHALHELLLFLRAFPCSEEVREHADRMLLAFDGRADLRVHRKALADTGIEGTDLFFSFYFLSARWLLRHCPESITIDWPKFDLAKDLVNLLHLLLPYCESTALDSATLRPRQWIQALQGADETDAAFLLQRFEALQLSDPTRELLYENLDVPLKLAPGPNSPSRTREHWAGAASVVPRVSWPRKRPNLKRVLKTHTFEIRDVNVVEGQELIDLANACMVNRHRDLYVFLNADPNDVRVIDFGDGLQFACMGAVPDRRLVLESVYGFLTMMNGIPIGYVLCSALCESSELAYNVFDNYRGMAAAHIYGCVVAMVHRMFGSTCFAVDPYQLGHKNTEGQRSGAWWFYYKLGFRPDDPKVQALVDQELASIAADSSHRTTTRQLNRMAAKYMFLNLGRPRRDVMGRLDVGRIGLHVSRYLAQHPAGSRERAVEHSVQECARWLDLGECEDRNDAEQQALQRWAPLVRSLPQVESWDARARRALAEVIRSKAALRETEFVERFDAHGALRAALLDLSARPLG